MNAGSQKDEQAHIPRSSPFLTRVLASALAVALTLPVGVIAYWLWVLVGAYLSLNRQLSGGGPADLSSAGATRWLDGVVFLLAICCVAAVVRVTLGWLGMQERLQHVHLSSLTVGAIVGVVVAMFLNQNLRLSPWPHLLIDVPEVSIGRFWPLVSALGIGFAFIGSFVGRRTVEN